MSRVSPKSPIFIMNSSLTLEQRQTVTTSMTLIAPTAVACEIMDALTYTNFWIIILFSLNTDYFWESNFCECTCTCTCTQYATLLHVLLTIICQYIQWVDRKRMYCIEFFENWQKARELKAANALWMNRETRNRGFSLNMPKNPQENFF